MRRYVMRGKFFTMAICVLILLPLLAFGQQRITVKGMVTDMDGNPLPGANVFIEGTQFGAATGMTGLYEFTAPARGGEVTLVARFIGYKPGSVTVRLVVGGAVTQNFELEMDPIGLKEIVVVGYGTARKEELTGSIRVVPTERLEAVPTTTFQDQIQGTPGVMVTSRDGAPGAGINIRVRGIGSITAGSEPLYVVDGVPMALTNIGRTEMGNFGRTFNALASLNPNDIESIVVLKDAASTAIYGSRGANGVILITTKGGVSSERVWSARPSLELKIQRGYSDFAFNNLAQGLTGEQYYDYFTSSLLAANRVETMEEADAQYHDTFPLLGNTDWLKEVSQTGITQSYDLSASGGGDRFNYFISAGYFDQQGTIKTRFFKRYSSRVNLTAQLTDRLNLSNNINISHTNQTQVEDGSAWESVFYMIRFMPPAVPIYNEEGQFYGAHQKKNIMGGNNPVGGLYENPKERETTRLINNFKATYQVTDELMLNSSWSFDIYSLDDYLFWNARYGDGRNSGGEVNEARSEAIYWQGTHTMNYSTDFAGVHNVDVVAGYEASKMNREDVEIWGEGFAHPNLMTANTAALITGSGSSRSAYAFESIFARANYNYDLKYYLSGSFRRDGSSRFGADARWGNFWSVGLGYTLTEESFMQDLTFFNYLKLRGSYGEIGNAEIGNYEWQGLYGFTPSYNGMPGSMPSQVPNNLLTWESQGNLSVGIDYAVWNNRITGSFEYYKKYSSDLLLDVPIPYTTGFSSVLQNFGDMENWGYEISMLAEIMRGKDFGLSLNLALTTQKNKITKLQDPFVDGTKRREEGRDYQEYYLYEWAGVNPDDGTAWYYTEDGEKINSYSTAGRRYLGKSATPDLLGSFGFSGHYKRFTFSAYANCSFGNYLFEGAARFYHGDGRYLPRSTSQWAWENAWKQPGDIAKCPQQKWGGNKNSQPNNSSRYLYKGDYIRLKNVRVAYKLPESLVSKMTLGEFEVYIDLQNYWTWVADEDLQFDPEQTISGVYNTGTPNSKTISFGANIGL